MAADLTQLRWQIVRATEQIQSLEHENYSLRKQLQEHRQSKSGRSAESEKLLIALKALLNDSVGNIKNDVTTLQSQYRNETSLFASEFSQMKIATEKLLMLTISQMNDLKVSRTEGDNFRSLIEGMRYELNTTTQQKNAEIERLKGKVSKLRSDLGESDHIKSQVIGEYSQLRQQFDELQESNKILQEKYETSQGDNKRLLAKIASMESQNQSSLFESLAQQQQLIQYYEKIISEMKVENEELATLVLAMEDQIQKLTNALLGNKSHFAKFVELKSENMQLQSKLSQLSKKMSSNLGITPMNGNNINTNSIVSNNFSSVNVNGGNANPGNMVNNNNNSNVNSLGGEMSVKKRVLMRRQETENSEKLSMQETQSISEPDTCDQLMRARLLSKYGANIPIISDSSVISANNNTNAAINNKSISNNISNMNNDSGVNHSPNLLISVNSTTPVISMPPVPLQNITNAANLNIAIKATDKPLRPYKKHLIISKEVINNNNSHLVGFQTHLQTNNNVNGTQIEIDDEIILSARTISSRQGITDEMTSRSDNSARIKAEDSRIIANAMKGNSLSTKTANGKSNNNSNNKSILI